MNTTPRAHLRLLPALGLAVLALAACDTSSPKESPVALPAFDADEKSLCGSSATWIEAESGDDEELEWARSVGNLVWNTTTTGDVSDQRWCSGALIGPNLFLTAGHCIDETTALNKNFVLPTGVSDPQDFCDNMHVQFNYQTEGGATPTTTDMPTFQCEEVLEYEMTSNDYALIRLEGDPASTFGHLEVDFRTPIINEAVTVIHHPSGQLKKISTGSVVDTDSLGVEYQADTLGGSSGAPVIDDAGRIIAVHTNAGCDATNGNYGRRTDEILSTAQYLPFFDYFDQRESDELEASDRYGEVLTTGDFNGDGYEDLLVGVPDEGPTGFGDGAGFVSARYGGPFGLDVSADFGFFQYGGSSPESGDGFGAAIASGDFNGDGYDDVAVGSPYEDWGSTVNTGFVQIFYGDASGLPVVADTFFNPTYLDLDDTSYAYLGLSLASGDFDGDGFDDLAMGAYGAEDYAGAVFVAYGASSALSTSTDRLDQGVLGVGDVESMDFFGWSLAAGDFDGDGYDDVAIGSPYETPGSGAVYSGHVTVVYGEDAGLLNDVDSFTQQGGTGPEAYDVFGWSLAAGDTDGDGYDDLFVGTPYEDWGSTTNAGVVNYTYGSSDGLDGLWYGLSQSSVGISSEAYGYLGWSLTVEDLDGDGYDELAIGNPYADSLDGEGNAGNVALVYGGSLMEDVVLFDGSSVGATAAGNDLFSEGLAAGDFNGDGDAELAIGIPNRDSDGISNHGAVVVFEGTASLLE